jgi:hypothetical protein
MKASYVARSLTMFMVSIVFLVLLTVFEATFSGMPVTAERIVSGLVLVLPGILGVIFGLLSLLRRESRPWLAILATLLNLLFAFFQVTILSFAG